MEVILCSNKKHNKNASFLITLHTTESSFLCNDCITEGYGTEWKNMIDLSECLQNKKERILNNWPPGVNAEFVEQLRLKATIDEKNQQVEQTNRSFDDLITKTVEILEVQRKKCLASIEEQFFNSAEVVDIYNKVSRKEQLVGILKGADTQKNILVFLADMASKQEENLATLRKLISEKFQFQQATIDNALKVIARAAFQIDYFKIDNQVPYSLVPGTYGNPNQIEIFSEQMILNKWMLQKNNKSDRNGSVMTDFVFDNLKKYIIRFQFNIPFYKMNHLIIGLINQNEIDSNKESRNCLQYHTYSNLEEFHGFQLYGSHSAHCEKITQIEMRVCIADNVLSYSDFPHYRATNCKKPRNQSASPLDVNQQWRIWLYLGYITEKKITVMSFEEVNEFSPLPIK